MFSELSDLIFYCFVHSFLVWKTFDTTCAHLFSFTKHSTTTTTNKKTLNNKASEVEQANHVTRETCDTLDASIAQASVCMYVCVCVLVLDFVCSCWFCVCIFVCLTVCVFFQCPEINFFLLQLMIQTYYYFMLTKNFKVKQLQGELQARAAASSSRNLNPVSLIPVDKYLTRSSRS